MDHQNQQAGRRLDAQELPEELRVLHGHQPRDAEALKYRYRDSGLDRVPDTFILYRIIGNDLYPRHAKGQSRANVRFILENEAELADCEKRWVLNRIFDAGERQEIIELLERHGQSYLEIPFEAEAFAQIGWGYSAYPEPGFLSSAQIFGLGPEQQERVLTATYRKKNLYLMNNNGARNAALEDGRNRAKWVLPWDGNCFVTASAWDSIRSAVRGAPYLPYFAVPMQRITDNAELLRDDFTPSPVEEPQLLFRRDARERFGENHPYGRRPKVELFWRLGIPGKWDRWKDDPWDQPRAEPSSDAGAWGVAGWVARLASGKAHLEASTTESFKNRGLERQKAIRAAINHVTREVSAQPDPIGLTCYRFEAVEALCAEHQEQGESGPRGGLLQTLLQNAADALERQPESPVDKPEPGPSGDLQDYYHPAPYWWPNPDTSDGLPYVRRDGERVPGTHMYEPESHRYDRTRLQRLFDDSTTLALAAFVTGDQRYATHALRWMERWFIDPATRMNPHLTYAQVRRGRNANRGFQTGVIEMKDLYYTLDAVRLLHHIRALSSDQLERLRAWFREYLDWLLTGEQGTKEAQARNNHGTYYDLQVAAVAAFLDDHDILYATLARAEERIPLQISPAGIQYEEMTRPITAHYCCFTLQGWLNLLNLAARFDGSFVARAAEPDHPLRKAVEWLLAHEGFPWPYPQTDEFDSRRFLPVTYLARTLKLTSIAPSAKQAHPVSFPPHDGIQQYWPSSVSARDVRVQPSRDLPPCTNVPRINHAPTAKPDPQENVSRNVTIAFPHRGAKSVLNPSGATISMILLASELRKIGINALVLIHTDGMSSGQYTGDFRQAVGPWAGYCQSHGVPCYTVDSPYMGKGMPTDKDQEHQVRESENAWRRALAALGVDVIHTNDASMHGTWGVLLEDLDLPHIWHERGLFKHKKRITHLRRSAGVIAISDYVKSLAEPNVRARCWVVENPVQVPHSNINRKQSRVALRHEFGLEEKSIVFAMIANNNARKRWDRFVDIAQCVRAQRRGCSNRPPVYFMAIGGGSVTVARILKCDNQAGKKHHNIILAGYRSPVFDVMAGLDCVLALADDEPLGRVLVEAGQLGVPVFANESGGHVHILSGRARNWLFKLDQGMGSIVDSCVRLSDDPSSFDAEAEALKEGFRVQFSPKAHAQRVHEVYRCVLPDLFSGVTSSTVAALKRGHNNGGCKTPETTPLIHSDVIQQIRVYCQGFQSAEVYKRYAEYALRITEGDIVDVGVAQGGSTAAYAYGLSLRSGIRKSVVYAVDRFHQSRPGKSHAFHSDHDVQTVVYKNQEALGEKMAHFGLREYVQTVPLVLDGTKDPLPVGPVIALLSLDAGPGVDDHMRVFYDRVAYNGWIVIDDCKEIVNRQGRDALERAKGSVDVAAFVDKLESSRGLGTSLGKHFLIARLTELFKQRGVVEEVERMGSTVFCRKTSNYRFMDLVAEHEMVRVRQEVRDEFIRRVESASWSSSDTREHEVQEVNDQGASELVSNAQLEAGDVISEGAFSGTSEAGMQALRGRGGVDIFVNADDPRLDLMKRKGGHGQEAVYKIWDWSVKEELSALYLDIGANYGEIALGASYSENSTVVLFEANPNLEGYLRKSIRGHARRSQMEVVMAALGEFEGEAEFALSTRSSGTSSLVFDERMLNKGAYERVRVPIRTLDNFSLPAIREATSAVLKIDVEGAELSVLKGGRRWLSQLDNYLAIVELNPRAMIRASGSLEGFVDELREYGALYEVRGSHVVSFGFDEFGEKKKNKDIVLVGGLSWCKRLESARF